MSPRVLAGGPAAKTESASEMPVAGPRMRPWADWGRRLRPTSRPPGRWPAWVGRSKSEPVFGPAAQVNWRLAG